MTSLVSTQVQVRSPHFVPSPSRSPVASMVTASTGTTGGMTSPAAA
jgi:hypothetical protein